MDLGLDSLGATELAGRLSKELGLRLPPTLIFSYPSINEITNHVLDLMGNREVGNTTSSTAIHTSQIAGDGVVAIVGMSCRFPGDINDLDSLWYALENKIDLTGEAPINRWDTDAVIAELETVDSSSLDSIRYGAFLSDEVIETFQNNLMGISNAEAARMDPIQRLIMEMSRECLLDAGYTLETLRGVNIGVFVAASGTVTDGGSDPRIDSAREVSVYDATGIALSVAAGRVSFCFGLQGPCLTVDTACSSSLVALHLARRSLQLGECSAALVVGASILSLGASVIFAVSGMISPDVILSMQQQMGTVGEKDAPRYC